MALGDFSCHFLVHAVLKLSLYGSNLLCRYDSSLGASSGVATYVIPPMSCVCTGNMNVYSGRYGNLS